MSVLTNLNDLPFMTEDNSDVENFNVAFSLSEWVKELEAERLRNQNTTAMLAFDMFAAIPLVNMFDAFATAPNGVFNGKPFVTVTQGVSEITDLIDFAAQLPEQSDKLLYLVEHYAAPEELVVEGQTPIKYFVRYALIPK